MMWALLGGLGLGLAAAALLDRRARRSPRARTARRMAALFGAEAAAPGEPDADAALFLDQRRTLTRRLRGAARDLVADIGGPRPAGALAAATALAFAGAAAGALSLLALGPLPALCAGAAAAFVVFQALRGELRRRRMIAFLDRLVDAVELIARSVRSGYAVPGAIRLAGEEIDPPVGPVFARIADEDALGVDLRDSLREAARAVRLPDFSFLAVALILQRESGGQLGDALDNLHRVLRKRKEVRLKLRAVTAEGRTSAMIVGALPFLAAGGVQLTNPAHLAPLFEEEAGRMMFAVGLGLLIAGGAIIRWMIRERP